MQTDNGGLIYACILDGRGGGHPIDWERIHNWDATQGTLWVHLNFTADKTQTWLRESSSLDEVVIEALLADETRPRSVAVKGGILASLRGINSNPGADPEDMVSIRLYSDGDRVITTRRRRLLSAQDISEALAAGQGPCTAGGFIADISCRLVERMSDVLQDIEDRIDQLEEEMLLNEGSQQLRRQIVEIRSETILLRRYLGPQREAMNRLQSEKAEWLSPDDRLQLRETADKVTRYVEDMDAVRDRAVVASEELAHQVSEQMNSRMYILSLITGIFLPLGFLTGLLGINVGGIPGADKPWGFLAVIIVITAIVAAQLLIFKRKKWF